MFNNNDVPDFLNDLLGSFGFTCGNPDCRYKGKKQQEGGVYMTKNGPAMFCSECDAYFKELSNKRR